VAAVVIHEPKASWAAEVRALAPLIRTVLGARARSLHPIGSTAVPGLAAKDVLDIQVTVDDFGEDRSLDRALATLGFTRIAAVTADHLPPGATDASRWEKRLYKLQKPRPVSLHVRRHGAPNAAYALLFRDYLRATPEAARAYEAVKRRLAAEHPDDPGAYADHKDPECDRVMEGARRWAEATGWSVPAGDAP
jgi:GrpB-like predicted nucleotidyltransferase (UPF0157 family)